MKDQYAGDFGDFVKLSLLRRLSADRRLAVSWYRTPDDSTRQDGRHIDYLEPRNAAKWRHLDPFVYDHLQSMVAGKARSINEIQRVLEVSGNTFFDVLLENKSSRAPWFALLSRSLGTGGDLLFLDPDNGIASPGFSGSTASVTYDEIEYLRQNGRTIVVYHHHTRAKGGHLEELKRIASNLAPDYTYRAVCAVRAASWSPRSFFIVAPDKQVWERAEKFAADWAECVTFHPLSDPPDDFGFTPGASAYHRIDAMEASGASDAAVEDLLRSLE